MRAPCRRRIGSSLKLEVRAAHGGPRGPAASPARTDSRAVPAVRVDLVAPAGTEGGGDRAGAAGRSRSSPPPGSRFLRGSRGRQGRAGEGGVGGTGGKGGGGGKEGRA